MRRQLNMLKLCRKKGCQVTDGKEQEHVDNDCNCTVNYGKVWANNEHTENMNKVNTLLTKTYWSEVKVDDDLF